MSRELCSMCAGSGEAASCEDCSTCGGSGFRRLMVHQKPAKDALKLAVECIERAFAEQDEHAQALGIGA